MLKDIKKQNRGQACRLLHCLVVAVRPLRIEELAEVLAVDFDDAEGIPKLKPDWRWEDHEQSLLTSCSSLIAIVKTDDFRVVQFSHFSVKEFLTPARLTTSKNGDVSRYYIDLEPAHTILAQACLSILLQSVDLDEENDVRNSSPLAKYAAQWYPESDTPPLYHAALCGFQDVVAHLVIKYPQHVNTRSGCYVTPLVAALAGGHSQIAKYLCDNGAHLNISGSSKGTPLHSAAWYGDFEMVQVLLDYKADINARSKYDWTPLHEASQGRNSFQNIPRLPVVARLLLERGTDVNVMDEDNLTPLHVAAKNGRVGVVRVLLEHGANVDAEDKEGSTPLHAAAVGRLSSVRQNERAEVVFALLEHGANVGAKDNEGRTPLQVASAVGYDKIVKLLSDYGAR